MTTAPPAPFSVELREQTTGDHRNAERSGFPVALVRGQVPFTGYVDLLAQHRYAYAALEGLRTRHLDDPLVGPFLDERLLRLPALDTDLQELVGADWADQLPPSPATLAYVDRIESCADWPGGHLAHHYTRYLGDLSGGIHIGAVAARTYELVPGRGGRFATFEAIDDPTTYKDAYRARLDALTWDEDERRRVIAEVHAAYASNEAVFDDLARHLD